MGAIPDPAAIPVTDADARQIRWCVLVVGDAARRFVDASRILSCRGDGRRPGVSPGARSLFLATIPRGEVAPGRALG
jgi:hypothetical protein